MRKVIRATTELVLKLPQWAQAHIQHINGLRLQAETLLKRFLDEQTPSKVYTWEPGREDETKRYVQDDRVYFELKDGRRICVALKDDCVELTGYSFGNLQITPHVSNQISVRLSDE